MSDDVVRTGDTQLKYLYDTAEKTIVPINDLKLIRIALQNAISSGDRVIQTLQAVGQVAQSCVDKIQQIEAKAEQQNEKANHDEKSS